MSKINDSQENRDFETRIVESLETDRRKLPQLLFAVSSIRPVSRNSIWFGSQEETIPLQLDYTRLNFGLVTIPGMGWWGKLKDYFAVLYQKSFIYSLIYLLKSPVE